MPDLHEATRLNIQPQWLLQDPNLYTTLYKPPPNIKITNPHPHLSVCLYTPLAYTLNLFPFPHSVCASPAHVIEQSAAAASTEPSSNALPQ